MTESLVISPRFCGPPGSGNGGYACGRIAAYVDGPVSVTLRRPPPLDRPMAVERDGESSVRIHHGGALIADATVVPDRPALHVPGPVCMAEAHAAAGGARYFADPVFPDCFVCGTGRRPGDGLRIFPGPLAGRPWWAAPWTPDPSVADADGRVRPEVVWAALDCPSGIAAAEAAGLTQDTVLLLGRTTASLGVPPAAGDQCLVMAWPGERDGRKLMGRVGAARARRHGAGRGPGRVADRACLGTRWRSPPLGGALPAGQSAQLGRLRPQGPGQVGLPL